MPDDAIIGFGFFDGNAPSIADQRAVFEASQHLQNFIAVEATRGKLGAATDAVSQAALLKGSNGPDRFDDFDSTDFIDGFDFIL